MLHFHMMGRLNYPSFANSFLNFHTVSSWRIIKMPQFTRAMLTHFQLEAPRARSEGFSGDGAQLKAILAQQITRWLLLLSLISLSWSVPSQEKTTPPAAARSATALVAAVSTAARGAVCPLPLQYLFVMDPSQFSLGKASKWTARPHENQFLQVRAALPTSARRPPGSWRRQFR